MIHHFGKVTTMDAVRQIVDGSALAPLIRLPKSLHDRKVEVIVLPVTDNAEGKNETQAAEFPRITRAQLDELKKTSKIKSLCGSIPHPPVTIAEIREERLRERYGSLD
jgi:hypothetical protein